MVGMMGCSMATPITAGLLGLVKSYHPDWTNDQVITQVLGTADDIDYNNPGYENLLGAGRINALGHWMNQVSHFNRKSPLICFIQIFRIWMVIKFLNPEIP